MKISHSALLGTAFNTLKITHVIAWSCIWVLASFWIPLAICIFFVLTPLVLSLIVLINEG